MKPLLTLLIVVLAGCRTAPPPAHVSTTVSDIHATIDRIEYKAQLVTVAVQHLIAERDALKAENKKLKDANEKLRRKVKQKR